MKRKLKRLKGKYRLVIIEDTSLKEIFSLKLSKIKLFYSFSVLIVSLLIIVLTLIVYTPIRYLVPVYGSDILRDKYIKLKERTDSLERKIEYNNTYIEKIKATFQDNSDG